MGPPPRQLRPLTLVAACALVFVASAAGTVLWCGSMSGGMPMPGAWTMSMAWMRMPGQSWASAALSFLAMWELMMVAMMLPSLVPMLGGFRRAVADDRRAGALTAIAAGGYFAVWGALGALVYPLGIAAAAAEMRWEPVARAVPWATGAALLVAGTVQLSPWKQRRLLRCQARWQCTARCGDARGAWREGLRLGVECVLCSSSFTAALLVAGVMNVGAMAVVAAAITVERLAPWPRAVARAGGVVLVAAGALRLIA